MEKSQRFLGEVTHERINLKIWNNEIKEVIDEKKIAYRRWLSIK
jgi:hypothetical protein